MKLQLNFCLLVTILLLTVLMLVIYNINIATVQNLSILSTLLSMTCFSLLIFLFGIIKYARDSFLSSFDADTGTDEEFLRISSIASLPKEAMEKIGKNKMKFLLLDKPVETLEENFSEALERASKIFSRELS